MFLAWRKHQVSGVEILGRLWQERKNVYLKTVELTRSRTQRKLGFLGTDSCSSCRRWLAYLPKKFPTIHHVGDKIKLIRTWLKAPSSAGRHAETNSRKCIRNNWQFGVKKCLYAAERMRSNFKPRTWMVTVHVPVLAGTHLWKIFLIPTVASFIC